VHKNRAIIPHSIFYCEGLNVTPIWIVAGVLLIAVNIPLYFLPSLLARNKRNKVAIFAVNLIFGWTIVGWFAVLLWALVADAQPLPVAPAVARFCNECANFSVPGSSACRSCGKPFVADSHSVDCHAA
jgi:hypothetical protein